MVLTLSDHHGSLKIFDRHQCIFGLCKLIFNPITYGILRFRQLLGEGEGEGEEGLFGPDPENKVNGLI